MKIEFKEGFEEIYEKGDIVEIIIDHLDIKWVGYFDVKSTKFLRDLAMKGIPKNSSPQEVQDNYEKQVQKEEIRLQIINIIFNEAIVDKFKTLNENQQKSIIEGIGNAFGQRKMPFTIK